MTNRKRLSIGAVAISLAVAVVAGYTIGNQPGGTALVGPEPGSQDFSVFVVGLNDVGPDDNIDSQPFDTATGWDFGDRFHYKCAAIEHFTDGVLDFQLDIERVGQVPDKPSNYVKISDQGGKESEGQGTSISCGGGQTPLVFDGTDHFPHHTHLHFFRDGVEFEMLDLHRDDCAKGYWTPGDEPGEAWLWWDADGPEHTHPGGPPLGCGGLGAEPVAVARAFVSFRAPGIGVCTHDDLDGSMCVDNLPPAPEFATVGYVGCSNSAAAVRGYAANAGEKMWGFIRNYGGGTVEVWKNEIATNGQHWKAFDRNQLLDPATDFWFQLCARSNENQNTDASARLVIAEILRRVPGARVWVSPLNGFVAPHVCSIAGINGPENMALDVADIVATGEAGQGPVLGSLISRFPPPSAGATVANNQTVKDGCHPNVNGEMYLGGPLLSFFG